MHHSRWCSKTFCINPPHTHFILHSLQLSKAILLKTTVIPFTASQITSITNYNYYDYLPFIYYQNIGDDADGKYMDVFLVASCVDVLKEGSPWTLWSLAMFS